MLSAFYRWFGKWISIYFVAGSQLLRKFGEYDMEIEILEMTEENKSGQDFWRQVGWDMLARNFKIMQTSTHDI
jgi:hypothetical protein